MFSTLRMYDRIVCMEEREKKVVPRVREIDDRGTIEFTNVVSLKRFPPKLRKLGKFLLETDEPCTISDACKKTGLNKDSVYVMIDRARKKGNDFQRFINEQASIMLFREKIAVHQSLVAGAVSGSHQHQKLYYQLTGDLQNTVNTTNITLAIGIASDPGIAAVSASEKGVIDVEPVIPDRLK